MKRKHKVQLAIAIIGAIIGGIIGGVLWVNLGKIENWWIIPLGILIGAVGPFFIYDMYM